MTTNFAKKITTSLIAHRITIYVLFLIVSQFLYQMGISSLQQPFFDEQHYVPAARQFITQRVNTIPEHPPLGIILIASSIMAGGDRPFGWRLGSALSGSLLLLGLLALCFACGLRRARVIYSGALLLCSHFIFVHARIAMLDIYLAALLIWALVLFVHGLFSSRPYRKRILLGSSALLWGATTCIKWIGLTGFAMCLIHLLMLKGVRAFNFATTDNPHSWHNPRYLEDITLPMLLAIFLLPFALGYVLPHLLLAEPQLLASIREIWSLQQIVPDNHEYQSSMWQWPLLLRPLWFEYYQHDDRVTQAIFCLGNPFLLLLGLVALCWSLRNWWRHGSILSFLNVAFYCTFYFFWLLLDRKVAYHYYYFLPALFLLLANGECFSTYLGAPRRTLAWLVLGVALLFFIFYYPVISGWPLPVVQHLKLWVWFERWF